MPDSPKIQIHQQNASVIMTEKPYPAPEANLKVISAQGGFNASKSVRLLMKPEATAQLFKSISWGSKPRRHDVEQAGVLVGKYYKDTSRINPIIWGEVVAVIPFDSRLVRASGTSIEITQRAWKKMLDEFVPHLNNGLLNLGWYHTHLDFTNTRLTNADKEIQRSHYTGEHSFALVINPNKKQWGVFYGPNADECIGEILATEEILEQFCEPKITIQSVSGDAEQQPDGTIVHRNTDGSIEKPLRPSSPVTDDPPAFLRGIGAFLERAGRRLSRPKHSTNNQHKATSVLTDTERDVIRQTSVEQRHAVITQREQNYSPSPKITVQKTVKPKIAILPKESRSEPKQIIDTSVFVVSFGDLENPRSQNKDGLQLIDDDILELVNSVAQSNANTSLSLGNPVKVHVIVNNDLTLSVRLCDEKCNAIMRISREPFKTAFSDSLIQNQIREAAAAQNQFIEGPRYLIYASATVEILKVVVIQIIMEDAA